MTNPYDPDPATTAQPGSGAAADPYSTSGASTASSGYSTESYTTGGYVGTSESSSTTDVAKDEASKTKDAALDSGKGVASTAKGEAANVVAEAKGQAKGLVGSVLGEARTQVNTQQQRLAGGIHTVAQELGSMGAGKPGPVAELAQTASQRVGAVGHWLETREPAEVLDELRTFARRRPGAFLGLSALAGVLVGRLGRGAVAANTSVDSPSSSGSGYQSAPSTSATSDYDTSYATSGTTTGTYASTYDEPARPSASLVEEPGTAYDSDYSITSDRDAGRGGVI